MSRSVFYVYLIFMGILVIVMRGIGSAAYEDDDSNLTLFMNVNSILGLTTFLFFLIISGLHLRELLYYTIPRKGEIKNKLERMNPLKSRSHHLKSIK